MMKSLIVAYDKYDRGQYTNEKFQETLKNVSQIILESKLFHATNRKWAFDQHLNLYQCSVKIQQDLNCDK